METCVYWTRLASNLKTVTTYNLQSNGLAVCLASEIYRRRCSAKSYRLHQARRERLKRVREREREVEMCGRARCTLRADDIPRACYRNNSSVRNLHMDRSVLTTNLFSSLFFISIIIAFNNNTYHYYIYRYRPSYNVSPGHHLPVVRREQGSSSSASAAAAASESDAVVVHCMKWGLIPSFTKKSDKPDHYKMVLFLTSLSHFFKHIPRIPKLYKSLLYVFAISLTF